MANFVAPIYALNNLFPKHLNFRRAAFISAVIGLVILPWNLYNSPAVINYFLGELGAILGPLFGYLCPRLPTDTPETKGIVFAVGAWILMMAAIVMFGNYRTFTAGAGFGTFAWLLITHAVFGIVLGNVYARLVARDKRMGATIIGGAHAH